MERLTNKIDGLEEASLSCEKCGKAAISECWSQENCTQTAVDRLAIIEDILGDDYDPDRLRELVQSDRDGRCVVIPCKIGDTLYRIQKFKRGKNWRKEAEYIRTVELNKNNFWRVVFEGELGKTVFLTREAAEAELKNRSGGTV